MTNPDRMVRSSGEEVTHRWIEDPVFDEYDNLDRDASDIQTEEIPAILSNPSEEEQEMLAGRSASASLAATVESDTDLATDREGWPDEIDARGRTYRVIEIIDESHPFAKGMNKKKALLSNTPSEGQSLSS